MCQMKNITNDLRGSNKLIVPCVDYKTTIKVYTPLDMHQQLCGTDSQRTSGKTYNPSDSAGGQSPPHQRNRQKEIYILILLERTSLYKEFFHFQFPMKFKEVRFK